jgi:hypothetical protein
MFTRGLAWRAGSGRGSRTNVVLVPVWPSAGWSSAAERTHPFWDIKPEDSTVNPSADEHKAAQWKAMIGMSRHIHHSMNTRLMEKTM